MKYSQIIKLIFAAFIFSVLAACSSGTDTSTTTATPGTGRVSLLITDGPTTDFDQINVTVESISFLCEDDDDIADDEEEINALDDDDSCKEVILFEETRVINLLALQNYSEMLSTTSITAGTYNKIRLHVSQVELVRFDINGDVIFSEYAKLSSNKIDLNPRDSFDIVDGSYLIVELDIDAEKSILVVETGNGKYIFRPVIFVNILGEQELKLVILEDRKVLASDTGFQLCEAEDVEVNDECLALLTSDNTIVQDDQINLVVPPEGLEEYDIVTVLGKVGYGGIDALHIVISADEAEPQNLALFAGKATSAVAVDDSFGMETDDDANNVVAPGTMLTATLAASARVFDKFGTVVSSDNIKDGSDVDVFGLANPDLIAPETVKAAFVIYDNDDLDDNFSGVIVAIVDSVITIEIDNDGISTTFECANIDEAIVLLLESAGSSSSSEEIAADQLLPGMSVDVYGEDEGLSCLSAEAVLVTALPLP